MDKIYNILQSVRPEVDFSKSMNFIEDGLLDSFDVISLISEIETEYNILIDGLDIVPDNFKSIDTIQKVILKNGGVI